MINFWEYFNHKNNNDIKTVTPLIKHIILIFFLIGLIISCVNKNNKKETSDLIDSEKQKSNSLNIKFEKADDTGVTEEGRKLIISANNKFALNLYSYLSSEYPNKNVFFSPYGIFTAMAMAYEGAGGQTANEMQSIFYFPENGNIRKTAIASIYNQLNKPKTEYQLLTANALWIQEKLQSRVFKEIQKYYRAKVFMNTHAKKINQWIEHKTMNKFKNVIQNCEPTSEESCGLSLINTIYFKGDWSQKFKKSNTKKKPFIISKKEKIKVPMMNMTKTFYYMETEIMQMLEMFYKGDDLSMLVLLPKDFLGKPKKKESDKRKYKTEKNLKKADLISLEKALTEKNLKDWKENLLRNEVEVYIPKFTLKKSYKLSKILKQHMPLAFDEKKADFLKFAENLKQPGQNPLYIKSITHKSIIDVNEEGTEAAAVTFSGMRMITSVPPPPPIFKANHPFIFLIQERETGQILFIGKVVNPM